MPNCGYIIQNYPISGFSRRLWFSPDVVMFCFFIAPSILLIFPSDPILAGRGCQGEAKQRWAYHFINTPPYLCGGSRFGERRSQELWGHLGVMGSYGGSYGDTLHNYWRKWTNPINWGCISGNCGEKMLGGYQLSAQAWSHVRAHTFRMLISNWFYSVSNNSRMP